MDFNRIYRAHDAIRPGTDYPLMKRIQAIRLLYQTDKTIFRLRPTNTVLQDKLRECFQEAILGNYAEETAQAYDTAEQMGFNLPYYEIQQAVEQQYQREIYGRHFQPRWQNFSARPKHTQTLKDISNDDVHNTKLNSSVKQAVVSLCSKYKNINETAVYQQIVQLLQSRNYLSKKVITSLRHIESDVAHFNIGIHLKRLFCCVGLWINSHPEREELVKRLAEELEDMSKTCSTGHMARLINVVQGYSDDLRLKVQVDAKKIIFDTMTSVLRSAPEEIVDGIIDKTPEYVEYVMNAIDPHKTDWNELYGEEIVQGYIDEYFGL